MESVIEATMRRLRFSGSLLAKRLTFRDASCPYCRGQNTETIARKALLMEVRRCSDCGLMFRWPKDSIEQSRAFYQTRYRQGLTTEVPSSVDPSIAPDRTDKLTMLRSVLPPPRRVLDFGCSWGYATTLFRDAGYNVTGFEISKPRAAFARKQLKLSIIDEYSGLEALPANSFDLIFACHVLEHLPTLDTIFLLFNRLLDRSGTIVLFMPNAGNSDGGLNQNWRSIINEKHTIGFDARFFRRLLPSMNYKGSVATSPYSLINHHLVGNPQDEGDELAIIASRSSGPSS